MSSYNYTTREGDRWDLLAYRFYGNVKSMNILTDANPTVPLSGILDIGVNIIVPIADKTDDAIITKNTPPWK